MKIFKRTRSVADKVRSPRTAGQAPRWVNWFTDIGRPLSAIVVMVLCAPGERHLALLAGWGPNLSWGMAGLLVMYAGIAAVVATVRPKGAPGKRTAVVGAILSLLLAMAAQPVSHYFVTGWMTAQPRPPFWLVTVVSCVPPFVMGHLLHLAADPGTEPDVRTAGQADAEAAATVRINELKEAVRRYEQEYVRPADLMSAMGGHGQTADSEQTGHRSYRWSELVDLNPGTEPDTLPDDESNAADILSDGGGDIPWSNPAMWSPDMADTPDNEPDGRTSVSADLAAGQAFFSVRQPDGETRMVRADGTESDMFYRHLREAHPDWNFDGSVSAIPDTFGSTTYPEGDEGSTAGYHDPVRSSLMYPAVSGETRESADALIRSVRDLATPVRFVPAEVADTGQTMPDAIEAGQRTVRPSMSGSELSAWIRDLWSLDPDMPKADVRQAVRDRFPDIKADTVRKAVTRVEEAMRS